MLKKILIIAGLLLLAKFVVWPIVGALFAATFFLVRLVIVAILVLILAAILGIRVKLW